MKIVCESCGAKYSIADEKVAGKVFKIRCKKCSAVIVVKGDQPAAGAGAPQATEAGGDAGWHVVVAGEQQGPFAPRQIGELLADGKIDWEAYVWREGMDGWQPAKDVPALVSAVMAEADSGPSTSSQGSPTAEALFGGSSDMGADPFASSDDGGLSGVIGQAAASASPAGGGADLFADANRRSFATPDEDDHAGSGGGRVSEGQAMTGQRNENSVLFSLSNLQALATGSGSAPASSARPKPGMAQGEGSGLIDIRALASATQTMAERPAGTRDKVEDLLAVGSTGTPFSATSLAAPVAVEKRDTSKPMLYAMGGLILALGGAVTYLAVRPPASQPTAELTTAQDPTATPTPSPSATGASAPSTEPAAAPQAAEPTPSAAAQPVDERRDEEQDREDDRSERSSSRDRDRRRRSSDSRQSDKGSDPAPTAAAQPAPEKKPASSGDKSLDDLLNTALGGKPAKATAKPESENLPPTPSREDVLTAMKAVTPRVQGCGGGQSGVAMAKVSVAGPTGKVTSVDVSGQFAGSPVATCISKEVSKAKFSRFSQSSFSFSYPFKL